MERSPYVTVHVLKRADRDDLGHSSEDIYALEIR